MQFSFLHLSLIHIYDVELSLVVLVHLNDVVHTTQRTDAFFRPEEIHMAGTAQLTQVDLIEVCLLYTSRCV